MCYGGQTSEESWVILITSKEAGLLTLPLKGEWCDTRQAVFGRVSVSVCCVRLVTAQSILIYTSFPRLTGDLICSFEMSAAPVNTRGQAKALLCCSLWPFKIHSVPNKAIVQPWHPYSPGPQSKHARTAVHASSSVHECLNCSRPCGAVSKSEVTRCMLQNITKHTLRYKYIQHKSAHCCLQP